MSDPLRIGLTGSPGTHLGRQFGDVHGAAVTAVTEAAYESARIGETVAVDL